MIKKQDNINTSRIKIQIISRTLPINKTFGSYTYLLDVLQYLQQAGCEVEYISIEPSPNGIPLCVIPSIMGTPANIWVRNNIRIGRVLLRFNSFLDWVLALPRLIYERLPQDLKNVYRFGKKRSQQRHKQQTNTTNAYVPDWKSSLATPEEVAFAQTQFAKFKPDVVIINYAYLANILDALSPDETILKVILTHDVRHQRTAHFKKIGAALEEDNWDWNTEAMLLRKAQVLLAIQEEDAKVFKEMVPHGEVICTPMSAICHAHTIKQVAGRCLFVGSNANHNYHGLQWFLENVWPKLIQLVPNCSLHVCGSVCDMIQGTFPNVRLLGKVDDLKSEYGAAEVCLIPLLAGSGLKIKFVEAMSYGRACVSTSVGVQGLREIGGKTAIVADTSEDFAAAVHTLLTNTGKRQWMEEQAHSYVTEKLSPQASYQPFVDYIHQHLLQVRGGMK